MYSDNYNASCMVYHKDIYLHFKLQILSYSYLSTLHDPTCFSSLSYILNAITFYLLSWLLHKHHLLGLWLGKAIILTSNQKLCSKLGVEIYILDECSVTAEEKTNIHLMKDQ